jgi:hypothetical protein
MTIRNLAEVRTRLEEAVAGLPGEPTGPAELFDLYEEIAIEVLDSEFGNYPAGALEDYLQRYLYLKRLELDLIHGPYPQQK